MELTFEFNPDSPESPQLALFDIEPRPTQGAKRFAYIPRLRFRDADIEHHLMIRDWGCYEFMRKYGDDRRHELTNSLHLDGEASLLIGNFNRYRGTWLVISVLRGIRPELGLFDTNDTTEMAGASRMNPTDRGGSGESLPKMARG
jgi:hypothetical protein